MKYIQWLDISAHYQFMAGLICAITWLELYFISSSAGESKALKLNVTEQTLTKNVTWDIFKLNYVSNC